jgi:hypothetical protein
VTASADGEPSIRISGGASAAEVVAVLEALRVVALRVARVRSAPSAYERWRCGRIAVLRKDIRATPR